MYKKLKSFLADDLVFTSLLLCCIAIAAFLVGRYSVLSTTTAPAAAVSLAVSPTVLGPALLVASGTPASSPAAAAIAVEEKRFVASKSSTKYHLITCPGAKRIKEENKIFFGSAAEAESAGYTPAANCPGI